MAQKEVVYVVSDSVGETAEFVVKAVATQFNGGQVDIRRNSYVEDFEDIEDVILLAIKANSIIAYTIVVPTLKEYLDRRAAEEGIMAVDLLSPLMNAFVSKFNKEPHHRPGLMRKLDEEYFRKIEAIEFAVKYDDGRDPRGITKADIVLIGVSRTSKTPLSMYLAHQRFKVANVPLVPEVQPPEELFQVPRKNCIGLVISPNKLNEIRIERLKALGLASRANYASFERILKELDHAEKIMKRVGCPVIDVSNKAVEETAGLILEVLKKREELLEMEKFVYLFHEGNGSMRDLLGGKGANLAEMTRIGLPVPFGFTITTQACNAYYESNQSIPSNVEKQTLEALSRLEDKMGKKLGDPQNPLLVSVRSGSVFSMPGMMDTILNLGMNDETVEGLAKLTNNPRFAYDSYRRFIQMFSNVVLEIDTFYFEQFLEETREEKGYSTDPEMTAEDWKEVIDGYKKIVKKHTRKEFPQTPKDQLFLAINAVFNSWNNQRAIVYRRLNKIPDHLGTAVNIQSMVFGNMGNDSGTGVAFTRNPSTGEHTLYGEYLINAQGEDVVAGIRTPQPIATLQDEMPSVYKQFTDTCKILEQHYQEMQDIEFTVERGKLFILQTRNGKRTAQAAIRIAVEMVEEGIIDIKTALLRVDPDQLNQLLHRRIDDKFEKKILAKGLPASPGAATGQVVFDADEAESLGSDGKRVILVRPETTPDDIHGIIASQAILTSRGGMTSHAAVVARGMGKACICGCEALKIDLRAKQFSVGQTVVKYGDIITIDGSTGEIMLGEIPMIDPELSDEFQLLLTWADQERKIGVRANADNPEDAKKSFEFGAGGIGLCRTEHMFMDLKRIPIVQKMILAENYGERMEALSQLLPMQQGDFEGIFEAMQGFPVTIRLLDPPLHEFLPDKEELLVEVTKLQITDPQSVELKKKEQLLKKVRHLDEFNPMLGHRGCRLGMIYPEIYEMQAKAIFYAAAKLAEKGMEVKPEIMIPLVGHVNELKQMRQLVIDAALLVQQETGKKFDYTIGTMIEIPRAALTADQIAEEADFFSFGTNDLTQTTFGFSRDDAEGKFLQAYIENKVLPENPFAVLDQDGVGRLVETGVKLGRATKPSLKTGICGEHGGEKSSIDFCYRTGLDYVSCSPYRVPLARLAAAQATILHELNNKEVYTTA